MSLTRAQASIWQKAQTLGAGGQAVALTEAACAYLVGRIALDLGLAASFLEIPTDLPPFFFAGRAEELALPDLDARALFERLVVAKPDADTYFACLATLQKGPP